MSKIREAYLQRCEIGLLARERNEGRRLCAGKMILCVTGLYRARRRRDSAAAVVVPPSSLAWIYCARDATATWYLLSAGRLPTNAGVIKPRECSHRARCARIQRHLLRTRRLYTREKHIVLQLISFSWQLFVFSTEKMNVHLLWICDVLIHRSP